MKLKYKVIKGWILNNSIQALTREELFEEINDNVRNKHIENLRVEPDEDKQDNMKRELPGICWHAQKFIDGKRNSKNAVPSGLVGDDFDYKDNPFMGDPREYFTNYIYPIREEIHLIFAYVSTRGKGLQIVCHLPLNATIAQAQAYIAQKVGLKHDLSCSNLDRVFLLPHKNDVLYSNMDGLFAEENPNSYTIELTGIDGVTKEGVGVFPQEQIDELRSKKFFSITLGSIFDSYVGTEKIPIGERNTTVFSKAHKLMALGLSTEELVALFSTVTSLSQAELRQACRTQPNYLPSDGTLSGELRRVIRQLRQEAGFETGTGLIPCRPIPKKLPLVFRELVAVAPDGFAPAFIIAALPLAGAIATRLRMKYLDNVMHSPSFMSHIVGEQAAGKSFINWLAELLLHRIRCRDEVARAQEQEYNDALKRSKNEGKQPEDPRPVIIEVPFTISVSMLLKRLAQAHEAHLISVTDEVATVTKTNKAGAWSQKIEIYRHGFDNARYGQDYLSENSFSGIFPVFYNTLSGGTPDTTEDFFRGNTQNGSVTRYAIARVPDNFAGKMPVIKPLTAKQKAAIEHGIDLLEQAEGEIRLPKLLKAMDAWLEEKAKLALETQSKPIDTFRRRSANIGFRAGGLVFKLCGDKETSVVVDFALWVADFVLQQQVAMWGQYLESDEENNTVHPVINLYKELSEEFTREELVNLRTINGQGKNVRMIIKRWKDSGMIQELEKNRYIKIDKQA